MDPSSVGAFKTTAPNQAVGFSDGSASPVDAENNRLPSNMKLRAKRVISIMLPAVAELFHLLSELQMPLGKRSSPLNLVLLV